MARSTLVVVGVALALIFGQLGVAHATRLAAQSAATSGPCGGYEVAFQANTGSLWTTDGSAGSDQRLGMLPGTSPAAATVGGGCGYEVAFQANTGSLWAASRAGGTDLHLGMKPGTSPAIASLAGGGYVIAFQANTGSLWVTGTVGTRDLHLGMAPGTSPAVTGLSGGGYVVAFQANTGSLWTTSGHGGTYQGLGMAPHTSPAITGVAGGGYRVAFQADTGALWTSDGARGTNQHLGMKPGTSPAIAGLSGGGYVVAFQANTGSLWTTSGHGGAYQGLGMAPHTSPAITGVAGGGYRVAFQANTGALWTSDGARGTNQHLGMKPGTSPAIAGSGLGSAGGQLPGGGQVMFPGRALVALYGHPGAPSLGVLGEQSAAASVARAKQVAAQYAPLYRVPVVPTFEIIAAVASGAAGADGDYVNESSPASLLPFVDAVTNAGGYVVLDLQPGRANVLDLAKRYASLLSRPNVGLALDPEWALAPGQVPLQQIGSLDASQINQVYDWLSTLTARAHLPQKVLVLHQFRLSMIRDESQLETGNAQVAVVIHADGQGPRAQKEATWRAVVAAAPKGVWFGWKNFYDEDPQLASPAATVDRTPTPVMVSYQ